MSFFCRKALVLLFVFMMNGSSLLVAQETQLEEVVFGSSDKKEELPMPYFGDSTLFDISFSGCEVGKKGNTRLNVEGLNIYLTSRFEHQKTKNGVENESAYIIQFSFFKNDGCPVGTPTDAYPNKVDESALRQFIYENPSIGSNAQNSKTDRLYMFIPFANLGLSEGMHTLEVRANVIGADSQIDLGVSASTSIEFEQPQIFYAQLLVDDIVFLPRRYDRVPLPIFDPNGHLPDLNWSLYRGEQKIYESEVLEDSLLGPDGTIIFPFCEGNHLFFCIKDQDFLDSTILYQEVFPSNGEGVIKNNIQKGDLMGACIEFEVWTK